MTQRFSDAAVMGKPRKTADGYLIADAFVARTGIQIYRGSEVGKPEMETVRVYRSEDQVKDPASVRTYSHAPITLGHPAVMVDADNVASLAKGEISTEAEWHEGKLKLPLIVKDAAAIAAIESGEMAGLSAGYTCTLDWTAGTAPDGAQYDAQQTNIRINHVALCQLGRAGEEFRIGDSADQWGATPLHLAEKGRHMADLQTVVLGDQAAQVAAADASKIEAYKAAMTKQLSDAAAALTEAEKKAEEEAAAKEKEMAKKDAEIADLKANALDAAAIDALVKDRADLVARAKAIQPDAVTDGKSAADIKRAVVVAKRGDAVKDKADAYIDAAFDLLGDAEDPAKKALADASTARVGDAAQLADTAFKKSVSDLNAWRKEA